MTTEIDVDGDFIDGLIANYPPPREMAQELLSRIDEALALRKDLEREKEKRAPAELRRRIRELEADLATVNRRLAQAQNLLPGAPEPAIMALRNIRMYAAIHRKEEWAPHVLRWCEDGGVTSNPLRTECPDSGGAVVQRITAYLAGGGLFNPELANHDAVRDLLIDARDALTISVPERRGG